SARPVFERSVSQQPVDREQGQNRYDRTTGIRRARLGFVDDLLAVTPLDPFQSASVSTQTDLVRVARDVPDEQVAHRARQLGAFDDEADLRIEFGGAWVEVERADEYARAIDGERFGMKRRCRAAQRAAARRYGGRRIALELVEPHAALEQILAPVGVARVDGGHEI